MSDSAVVTGPQLTVFRVKKPDAATISPNQVTRHPGDCGQKGLFILLAPDTTGIFKESPEKTFV